MLILTPSERSFSEVMEVKNQTHPQPVPYGKTTEIINQYVEMFYKLYCHVDNKVFIFITFAHKFSLPFPAPLSLFTLILVPFISIKVVPCSFI